MCGIAGYSRRPNGETFPGADLALALALAIERRGPHATGYGWTDPADEWPYYWKSPGTASKVATDCEATDRHDLRTVLVHTRWATQGDPKHNVNNHPVVAPGIVLTHNGTVSNDRDLFQEMAYTPMGEVDSEVFAALLATTTEEPWKALERVDCDATLAWLNADEPGVLHLARVMGRTLYVARTRGGALVYASTSAAIRHACAAARVTLVGQPKAVPEGTYLRVEGGRVTRQERFRPLRKPTPKVPKVWVSTKGAGLSAVGEAGGWYAPPAPPVLSGWRREQAEEEARLLRAMHLDDAEAAERQARESKARYEQSRTPETKAEAKRRRKRDRRDRMRRAEAEAEALDWLDAEAPKAGPTDTTPPATTPQKGTERPHPKPSRPRSLLETWDRLHWGTDA